MITCQNTIEDTMRSDFLKIGGAEFTAMLASGFKSLCAKEEEINKLNVFPVPDGDTGKNMRMTYESGLKMLKESGAETVGEAASVFARGMLLGARGNSGVILSQIFKGMALGLEGCIEAYADDVIRALDGGVKKSYKAVVKPVEGTMLTVFRECSECAADCKGRDMPLPTLFDKLEKRCAVSLENTPSLLAVLKDAGVVDSGGAGLLCVFRGFLNYFSGDCSDGAEFNGNTFVTADNTETAVSDGEAVGCEEYGYCTEFLLSLSNTARITFETETLVKQLESVGGQSIVALRDEDIVKVHVHVLTPGDVLNIAQSYGEFITIKVENMTLQHSELVKQGAAPETVNKQPAPMPKKDKFAIALVAVADDGGFTDLFYSMGADCVVGGGQSMNPSVEDFLNAFRKVDAEQIIVLPNNSNVIMTAEQAAGLYGGNVRVLPTKSLAQGYSAISIYNPDEPLEEIVSGMEAAASTVISAEVTRAVRDARCDGVDIKKSQTMVILNGKVAAAEDSLISAFRTAIEGLDLSDKCVITLFCGESALQENTDKIKEYIKFNYPALEVSEVKTGQPVYDYIVAIE